MAHVSDQSDDAMAHCYSASSYWLLAGLFLFALALVRPTFAQPAAPARPPAGNTTRPAGTVARATPARPKHRQLAPGAMKAVNPERQVAESFSRHNVIEVLASDPSYAERDWSQGKSPARDAVFRREVWALEFAFKPVRFVHVDVPSPDGRLTPKLVWYLVYSIRNNSDKPVPFVPRIVLASRDTRKVYPDRLIPLAVPLIRKREDPSRPLKNTVEITGKIPPTPKGQEPNIWGVATWEDIDPRTDYFSIYIQGLTNADLWEDPPGAFKKGDRPGTGREFYPKTLILNFWRPSDKEEEHEDEIRYDNYSWQYGQLTERGFVAKKPNPAQPAPQDDVQAAQD